LNTAQEQCHKHWQCRLAHPGRGLVGLHKHRWVLAPARGQHMHWTVHWQQMKQAVCLWLLRLLWASGRAEAGRLEEVHLAVPVHWKQGVLPVASDTQGAYRYRHHQ
jgi:hypothetical protein